MDLSRILLINPRRGYISSEYGLGYQTPLGLIMIGGPLSDAGFKVKIIDADVKRLNQKQLLKMTQDFDPQLVGISHTGSTAAHLEVVETVRYLKKYIAGIKVVYGGVYPTFAFRAIMNEISEIDFIVRGEGEATAIDLAKTLKNKGALSEVKGLIWRRDQRMIVNKARPLIHDLDKYRPGWELVDWRDYKLLGQRASGIQFARGCPNSCGFCGQWVFWRSFRHRSPKNFVHQLELLVDEHEVRHIWPADEHFTADREALEEILELLTKRDIRASITINASVDSIIRDRDILHLYKRAGIDFIAMGVESDDDSVVESYNKSTYDMACEAVKLLRDAKILSCVNVIYGLEDESWKTMLRKGLKIRKMDPDFVNATYLTPHFWTRVGSKIPLNKLIQPDPARWGYRNQVVHTPNLSPRSLFFGVKLTELILHGRPKRIWRAIFTGDKVIGKFGRRALYKALIVWFVEIFKDFPGSKFIDPGGFDKSEGASVLMPRSFEKTASDDLSKNVPSSTQRELEPTR